MHTEIIQKIIDKKKYTSYLEIGMDRGLNWAGIKCEKKYGCDPLISIPSMQYGEILKYKNEVIYCKTSDDFFYSFGYGIDIDLVFIDGHHTFEQSLKDYNNSTKVLSENGTIIMHDTNPGSELESMIYHEYSTKHKDYTGAWVGDVWKTIYFLRQRGNVEYFSLDIPCGITILKKPNNKEPGKPMSDISKLEYKIFDENRKDILNLKPITYLGEWLNAH